MDDNALEELAAMFNRDITDEDGQITTEETVADNTAGQEINTDDDATTAEKSEDSETEDTKSEVENSETESVEDDQPVEDESGKKYIPQKRFDKVYKEKKELERKLKSLESNATMTLPNNLIPENLKQPLNINQVEPSAIEQVEFEVLFGKFPQFDPESKYYSRSIDSLGAEIMRSNPKMSKLTAAKRALDIAKGITQSQVNVQAENRALKSEGSDTGITSRVINRQASPIDPATMTLEQKEEWLRKNGEW